LSQAGEHDGFPAFALSALFKKHFPEIRAKIPGRWKVGAAWIPMGKIPRRQLGLKGDSQNFRSVMNREQRYWIGRDVFLPVHHAPRDVDQTVRAHQIPFAGAVPASMPGDHQQEFGKFVDHFVSDKSRAMAAFKDANAKIRHGHHFGAA